MTVHPEVTDALPDVLLVSDVLFRMIVDTLVSDALLELLLVSKAGL